MSSNVHLFTYETFINYLFAIKIFGNTVCNDLWYTLWLVVGFSCSVFYKYLLSYEETSLLQINDE